MLAREMGSAEPTLPITTEGPALDPSWRGTTIGRYLVLSRLGAGGVGEVFEAYDPQLDRRVALKLLRRNPDGPPGTAAGEQDWRTLLREAQALARLSDPHVVVVHDVGVFEGRTFLAMELVDGVDLELWLRRERADWRTILRVLLDAGAGLAAAHGAGVVHRDFKPANVLVGRDGRIKVGDFGLARHRDEELGTRPRSREDAVPTKSDATNTQTSIAPGTPFYMAPELFAGDEASVRTDVYAYCVALYEALAGHRPHQGETTAALLAAKQAPLAPIRARGIPRGVSAAIETGLAVDPAARWPDMATLLAALRRASAPRRWRATLAIATATLAVASWGFVRVQDVKCDGGQRHLASTWNAGRKDAILSRGQTSDRAFALAVASDVVRAADDVAQRWSHVHLELCERSRHEEQSNAALDARMACLEETRLELGAVLDAIDAGADSGFERASLALRSVQPPEPCASLLPGELPPTEPELRARLAEAHAELEFGNPATAEGIARDVAAEAIRLGDRRGSIDAQRIRGLAEAALGRSADAERTLSAAVFDAQAFDAREQQIAIAISLAILLTNDTGRYGEADRWIAYANAELAHGGPLERFRGRVLTVGAGVKAARGDLEEALGGYERAVAWEAEHEADAIDRANTLGSYAMSLAHAGRIDAAIARAQEAIDLRTEVLGADHPRVGMGMTTLGRILADAGRRDEAADMLARAEGILAGAVTDSDVLLAELAIDVSANERLRGHLDEAAEAAAGAVALLERRQGGGGHTLFVALDELANAEGLRGDRASARTAHTRAVALGDRLELPAADRANVRVNYGAFLREAGEADAAAAYFGEALELLGDDAREAELTALAWLGLGEVELVRGRRTAAAAALDRLTPLLAGVHDAALSERAGKLRAALR